MTGRVMRLIAEEKALEQMNAVQREIATEWLDDRPLEEIADEVSLPVRVVQSWVATVEVIIDIELRRLREVYLCGYGRQGWIEM
jgi:DNA-directed RNA polymerase specialized sigma24 family protein